MQLLTYSNPKTMKGESRGYLTAALHLAPAATAMSSHNKRYDLCQSRCSECHKYCLAYCGYGKTYRSLKARRLRALYLLHQPGMFIKDLHFELDVLRMRAKNRGLKPAARLNATSDVKWVEILSGKFWEEFEDIQFYDYTKHQDMAKWYAGQHMHLEDWPENYTLAFSRSSDNDGALAGFLGDMRIAVISGVPKEDVLDPPHFVDGDEHDLLFDYPENAVLVLSPKGQLADSEMGRRLLCANETWFRQVKRMLDGS